MTRQARILVPSEPSAIAFARDRVLTHVRAWGVSLNEELRDAVKLVASELITNAVVHGGGFTTVGLYLNDGRLLLVVHDGNPAEPQRQYATGDEEAGRGLALVDFLAARNGWEPTARGKKVWAEFEVPVPSPTARGEIPRRRMKAAVPRAYVNTMPSSLAMAVGLRTARATPGSPACGSLPTRSASPSSAPWLSTRSSRRASRSPHPYRTATRQPRRPTDFLPEPDQAVGTGRNGGGGLPPRVPTTIKSHLQLPEGVSVMTETRNIKIPPFTGDLDLRSPHFIAIGGAGMSGLAHLLREQGADVSGSDLRDSGTVLALSTMGCTVHVGHNAAQVVAPTAVIWSSGIDTSNVELAAATQAGIPLIHRSQALGHLLSQAPKSVVVAGTHGKSTTTAMLGTALGHLDASWVGGGALVDGRNAYAGSGGILVAEGDESDPSLTQYRPDVAVVLNVDDDHPETYVDREDILGVFEVFVRNSRHLVVSADDEGARVLTERVRRSGGLSVTTVGESEGADYHVVAVEQHGEGSRVVMHERGRVTTSFIVPLPGRVTALNAAAAFAAGRVLGADAQALADGLGRFPGIQRRMTLVGEASGVVVRDSFAHHARAIETDLTTGRELTSGSLVAVFEPCGWTRTLAQGPDMGKALAAADDVVLLDVHSLVTSPFAGVTTEGIEKAINENGGRVHRVHDHSQVAEVVGELVRSGDLVITMGTGGVTALGTQILAHTSAAVITA